MTSNDIKLYQIGFCTGFCLLPPVFSPSPQPVLQVAPADGTACKDPAVPAESCLMFGAQCAWVGLWKSMVSDEIHFRQRYNDNILIQYQYTYIFGDQDASSGQCTSTASMVSESFIKSDLDIPRWVCVLRWCLVRLSVVFLESKQKVKLWQ